ncbi:MAG: 50S ribosomal protein L18 [Methylococcales bacterium]
MYKREKRLKRATKTRARISDSKVNKLTVHRTPRHIYAQIIDSSGSKVVVSASTVQGSIKSKLKVTGNVEAAKIVGQAIAEKAKAAGVEIVAFDRSGFKYHGRVQALAEAAREGGLKF